MADPSSVQVPNPVIGWLQALLSRVQGVQASIPSIDAPTASIGPGPAWTGSTARGVHDHDLAPYAKPFKEALNSLDDQVSAKIAEAAAASRPSRPASRRRCGWTTSSGEAAPA